MKLEKIITLASRGVRLRFLAKERSLRAAGCDLPLWVIPYDGDRFDLPSHATWWEDSELIDWLDRWSSRPVMRKYQCLTTANYQFVDADVCFLQDPATVLEAHTGFVTSCGHWHNPGETVTEQSLAYARTQTTVWQSRCFNTGQFACDRRLYSFADLRAMAEQPDCRGTCLELPYHEQPGLNLLVWRSGIPVTNLTLPPVNMESTWAGDYPEAYGQYWSDRGLQPYLIHWAGLRMDVSRPIDDLFLRLLTQEERREWDVAAKAATHRKRSRARSLWEIFRRARRAVRSFAAAFRGE